MPWPLRLIELRPRLTRRDLEIGDCLLFNRPMTEEEEDDYLWPGWHCEPHKLSDYYHQNNSHRPPLLVWMPCKTWFCVDSKTRSGEVLSGGWTVSGEPPLITVSPSINMVGSYHGFITNGVITDDCEGRTFL